MGLEANCVVRWAGKSSNGLARLEEDALYFRGDFRLKIPFRAMSKFEARRGELVVTFPEGTARFALGPAAEKWWLKIRYPRPVLDKLGAKPGMRVAVLGVRDESFLEQLHERVEAVATRPKKRLRPRLPCGGRHSAAG